MLNLYIFYVVIISINIYNWLSRSLVVLLLNHYLNRRNWQFSFCWMGRGDHPKKFLPKIFFCENTPLWLKVMGCRWWWVGGLACEIILSSSGTGCRGYSLFPFPFPIPISHSHFPIPSPVPVPSPKVPSPSRLII